MLKKIVLLVICLSIALFAGSMEAMAADNKTKVGRAVLDELLPVQNRLRDLLVLLNSARPNKDIGNLKKEISQSVADLDAAIPILDKNFDKTEAAKIRQDYAAKEKIWRERVVALIGRSDLPHVSCPTLTTVERVALYAHYVVLCEEDDPSARAD
ncbi:MAG: hypothetical protein PHT33_06695, partial [bacterium]|nr:hypothetical protein [bacterium]